MKLKVRKRLLALLLGSTLALCKYDVCANSEFFDKGDIVTTTVNVNMRLDGDLSATKLLAIEKDTDIYRILSLDNDWHLVSYNNQLGYVNGAYIQGYENSIYDDVVHYQTKDTLVATDNVNFRLGPSVETKKIGSLKKGDYASIIAYTDNNWYLVNYNDKIGYVSGEFAISLKSYLNELFPNLNLEEIRIEKIAYTTSSLNVRSEASIDSYKIGVLDKYESMVVLKEYDEWYFVKYGDNNYGYVMKSYTKELTDEYVVIDLSEQRLWLYKNNQLVLTTSITTGKNTSPTNIGLFKIYSKEEDRYLTGEDYQSWVEYWMPFDGGIGLHDASWRRRFGGEIYQNNGSHGCVNLPKEVAETVYNNVSVGTKVLVHK